MFVWVKVVAPKAHYLSATLSKYTFVPLKIGSVSQSRRSLFHPKTFVHFSSIPNNYINNFFNIFFEVLKFTIHALKQYLSFTIAFDKKTSRLVVIHSAKFHLIDSNKILFCFSLLIFKSDGTYLNVVMLKPCVIASSSG